MANRTDVSPQARVRRLRRMKQLYERRAREARDNGEERKARSLDLAARRTDQAIEKETGKTRRT